MRVAKKAAAQAGSCQNTEILFVNSRELSLGNVQAQTVNDILGSTDQVGHDDVSGNADLNSLTSLESQGYGVVIAHAVNGSLKVVQRTGCIVVGQGEGVVTSLFSGEGVNGNISRRLLR